MKVIRWMSGVLTGLSVATAAVAGPPHNVILFVPDGLYGRLRLKAETVPFRLDAASYLAKLSSKHKEMIQLWFFEGLTHIDIAARLGISEGNARVRLCRALLAVKIIAGNHPQEDRP